MIYFPFLLSKIFHMEIFLLRSQVWMIFSETATFSFRRKRQLASFFSREWNSHRKWDKGTRFRLLFPFCTKIVSSVRMLSARWQHLTPKLEYLHSRLVPTDKFFKWAAGNFFESIHPKFKQGKGIVERIVFASEPNSMNLYGNFSGIAFGLMVISDGKRNSHRFYGIPSANVWKTCESSLFNVENSHLGCFLTATFNDDPI